MTKVFSLKTPLARAKGLGSSKNGSGHWIAQRVSAIALACLGSWLVWVLLKIGGYPLVDTVSWFRSPLVLLAMSLTVLTGLYHGYLGLQIVIEDYVSHHGWRIGFLVFIKFLNVISGGLALLALLKLGLGSSI